MLDEDIALKITTKWVLNLKTKEAQDKVKKANQQGLKDSLVDIVGDVIKGSPIISGHNRRSIAYKLGSKITNTGTSKADEPAFVDWEPPLREGEAAVYSTSGYGGFLETGTVRRPATPYFKPALDMNIKNLPKNIKGHLG